MGDRLAFYEQQRRHGPRGIPAVNVDQCFMYALFFGEPWSRESLPMIYTWTDMAEKHAEVIAGWNPYLPVMAEANTEHWQRRGG